MDPINPYYYVKNGLESINVIETFVPDKPYRWAPLKYLFRAGRKPGQDEVQDLRKALWWIEREIAQIESRFKEDTWTGDKQAELETRVAKVAGRAPPTCPDLDQEYDLDHAPGVR